MKYKHSNASGTLLVQPAIDASSSYILYYKVDIRNHSKHKNDRNTYEEVLMHANNELTKYSHSLSQHLLNMSFSSREKLRKSSNLWSYRLNLTPGIFETLCKMTMAGRGAGTGRVTSCYFSTTSVTVQTELYSTCVHAMNRLVKMLPLCNTHSNRIPSCLTSALGNKNCEEPHPGAL